MKYKHLIWDWNGTLVDDLDATLGIFVEMSASYGMRVPSRDEYRNTFGFPVKNFYIEMGMNPEKYDFEKISEYFGQVYAEARKTCPLQKGAIQNLEHLKNAGVNQSILSAYEMTALREAVGEMKLVEFFEEISGLSDLLANSKVELGKRHVEKLNLDKSKTLMVGDTLHDAEVSRGMGVDCVLLSCGHHSAERLESAGLPVFHSHGELLKFFLS